MGVASFTICGALFNVILPLLNIYNFLIIGRLSSILPSLFFAYAITKHDFMDITVIINNKMAWFITFILIISSYLLVFNYLNFSEVTLFFATILIAFFWAFSASSFQQFLLTSARRKFIRNWYEPDDVISEIAEQLTVEKNRESIFISSINVR